MAAYTATLSKNHSQSKELTTPAIPSLAPQRLANILYAEDCLGDIILNYHLLKDHNVRFNEFIVRDGEEMIDFLEKRAPHTKVPTPDIILLDLNMPKLDGRAALVYLKIHAATKGIPLVVISGSTDRLDHENSMKQGACHYISKPLTFEKLQQLTTIVPSLCFDNIDGTNNLRVVGT